MDYGSIIFYGAVALLTAACAEYSVRFKDVWIRGFFAWNAVLIPSVIAGLRYGIGTDYLAVYLPEFQKLQQNPDYGSRMEFGYVLLNKLVAALGGGFQFLLFLVSFLTVLFFYLGLKQYREEISVGLGMFIFMLLYYQLSYNMVRQAAAMSIVFYALRYIVGRRFWKYCLFLLLASAFHASSLLFLPFYFLYFLYGKEQYRFVRGISYLLIVVLALNYNTILYPVFKSVDSLSYYANYFRATKAFEWSIGIFARTLPFLLPGLMLYKKLKEQNRLLLLFNLVFLGCIIRLTAYTTVYYTERIALYFLLPQVVLVPWYCRQLKKRKQSWLGAVILACVVFLWIYDFFMMGVGETVPYVSVFSVNY